MKNVLKNTKKGMLMVALFATITVFAKDANTIIKTNAKKTSIVLEHVKEGDLVFIKDQSGLVLYKEAIQANGVYKKGFDLTALPEGNYVFELEKDLEISTMPFSVVSNTVIFNKADEVTYFKPHIRQAGDLVLLTELSPKMDPTSIDVYAIYDDETVLRHSEKVENAQIIEKAFKLEKGKYKIVISSNNKEYTTYINN